MTQPPKRPTHPWLFALPGGQLPTHVVCDGRRYELVETFKHDFFAATGLYRDSRGTLAVLKMGRQMPFLTIPMRWLGDWLTRREVQIYAKLQSTPGIPKLIGMLSTAPGFLHEFVPGHPLGRDERVSDSFFDELFALLQHLHQCDIAYVDLNKRQNVLVGDDGRPYLIDFQISLDWPATGWRGLPPARWLLARFQHEDVYHALKHKRRLRPDLLSEDELRLVERVSFWIRLHRVISRPFTNVRRRTLKRLAKSETMNVLGSTAK